MFDGPQRRKERETEESEVEHSKAAHDRKGMNR